VVDGFGDASGDFALNLAGPSALCGNGIVDPGEQCDGVASGCCSTSCRFEPSGSTCATDADPCTTDRCDGLGTCAHEGCSACLTCDPDVGCVDAPAPGCAPAIPGGASLTLTNAANDKKDRVVWRWKGAAPNPKEAFGDPRQSGYDLCIYE